MAAPNALKQRIEILQMAEAQGKELRPEHKAELAKYRADGLAKGGDAGSGTESERTAAFLATRLGGAIRTLRATTETKPDAAKPGAVQEMVRSVAGDTAANFATGEARQQVEAAQLEALDSALTLGTGAAYTREQLEGYRRAYFPVLGDSPATIADKQARLDTVIKAARIKAGAAASSIDEALGNTAPAQPSTATGSVVGFNDAPVTDAINKAAGVTSPADDLAATEQGLRDLIAKGGDDKAAMAFLATRGFDPTKTTGLPESIAAARAGKPFGFSDATKPAPPAAPVNRGAGGVGESIDAGIRGAADTATLGFADEISAAGKTVFGDGTMRDNLARERATDRYDETNNAGARITGQLAGGFALPMGTARGAAALGRTGAAYGAGYGFGSTDGSVAERAGGALRGGAIGGVGGLALGGAASGVAALGARRAAGNAEGRAVIEAGDRLGIDALPADVGGGGVRNATAAAAQFPGSASTIRAAGQRVNQQALGARDRIAAGVGNAVEPEAAGEAARTGADAFITRTRGVGNGAYARAERLAAGSRINPANARMALDRNIAELSEVPGGAEGLAALQDLRDQLDGDFTVAGIRGMRSALRDRFIADGLRGSDVERRVNQVIDAANNDVLAGLRGAGNDAAAKAYAVADRYWRNRLRVIDDTLAPIIGKNGEKSGEAIVQALNTAAKGNSARLASFVRALPAEEAATVRATMISQLGRANAGTQDAAGGAFSLGQFLTHWNQMQPGARRALFDADTTAALNDLAVVANGSKQAQRFANTSNTGGVVAGLATGATAAIDIATLGKTLALQYGAGRLLASPRFARWLAGAPNANPGSHIRTLSAIAAREPAIAQEVLGLQARLAQAVKSPQPVAAEEPDGIRKP